MKAHIAAIALFTMVAVPTANATNNALSRCGNYTLWGDFTGTTFAVEDKGNSYPATYSNCSNDDPLTDIECYSATLPEGAFEIVRIVTWYEHRDRVQSIEAEASLQTPESLIRFSCK